MLRGDALALIEAETGHSVSHGQLQAQSHVLAARLSRAPRALAFCFCRNDIASVIGYLAAKRAGAAVALLDAGLTDEQVAPLVEAYDPELMVGRAWPGAVALGPPTTSPLVAHRSTSSPAVFSQLGLLLSTSGSTGSPKWVRHSRAAVAHNVGAICQALDLQASERAMLCLPFSYAFGLSVLHTHLKVGGSLVLCGSGPVSAPFWEGIRQHGCTSLYGVPYVFELLRRLGLERAPSLRHLRAAGGKLPEGLACHFSDLMTARAGDLSVMYGQSEAVARMAIMPASLRPHKPAAAGLPLPGGAFSIESDEVIYRGPNVMLGYARGRADLTLGDQQSGVLHTGDLGHLDTDGALTITGRRKRIAKVAGLRLNLDEIETLLRATAAVPVAAVASERGVRLICEGADEAAFPAWRLQLARDLHVHHSALAFQRIAALPRGASGKVDYQQLGGGL